jgi:hypothetical protein
VLADGRHPVAIDALAPFDRIQVAEENVEEAGLRVRGEELPEGRR